MSSLSYFMLVLCSSWITTSYGSFTFDMLKDRHVIITGPQDVDVFLRSADTIMVAWTMPQIYIPHDASDEGFENLEHGKKVDLLKPLFSYEPHEIEKLKNESKSIVPTVDTNEKPSDSNSSAAPSPTSGTNVTASDLDTDDAKTTIGDKKSSTPATTTTASDSVSGNAVASKSKPTAASSVNDETVASTTMKPPVKKRSVDVNFVRCKALTEFANFTVGEKKPLLSDNGWALSLLDSNVDIQVTNMSMFYSKKDHKIVKFEEGCVKKVVVTYSRQDNRLDETEIELSPLDHLVTIDNLKPGTEYRIVVTTHFFSNDSISTRAIYVTTLRTGVSCLCDWHGTVNQTNDCESPSTSQQHCDCRASNAGRFCQDCAAGFYRDRIGDGCKRCPCSDHGGLDSSCTFVEGFLLCDKCATGYTGSVCHKCDNGYFRYKDQCRECHCHNKTRPGTRLICNPTTGSCNDCHYNTTGYYCERCLPGYVRDPKYFGNCFVAHEVKDHPKSLSSKSSGVSAGLAGVIVLVVLLVCGVVGVVIIYRVRANRQRRALWTVEMRPDSDDLDFNSVHNEDARMDEIDDMEFYDRQAGRSKTSGKYSKLNEEC